MVSEKRDVKMQFKSKEKIGIAPGWYSRFPNPVFAILASPSPVIFEELMKDANSGLEEKLTNTDKC